MLVAAWPTPFACSGSNWLFSMLRGSGNDEERKRHDKTIEELQASQADWSRKQTERLEWINEELGKQGHGAQTFRNVDAPIREYSQVTGQHIDPPPTPGGPEPLLSDFFHPSDDQKDRKIAFVILWMAATGLVAYKLAK